MNGRILNMFFPFGFLLGFATSTHEHLALAESIIAFLLICIGVQIAWHGVHALMTTNR